MKNELLLLGITMAALLVIPLSKHMLKVCAKQNTIFDPLFI